MKKDAVVINDVETHVQHETALGDVLSTQIVGDEQDTVEINTVVVEIDSEENNVERKGMITTMTK